MNDKLQVYIISGCSGSGKTTLAKGLVENISETALISGDIVRDFYADKYVEWGRKYDLTWQNILLLTENFLNNNISAVIEYLYAYEDEIEKIYQISKKHNADMRYIVLTASEAAIKDRLISRGDPHLIEKALNMQMTATKNKFNKPYLFDGTDLTIETQIRDIKNTGLYPH